MVKESASYPGRRTVSWGRSRRIHSVKRNLRVASMICMQGQHSHVVSDCHHNPGKLAVCASSTKKRENGLDQGLARWWAD